MQTPGSTQIVNTDVYRDINQKIEYTDDNLSKIDKLLGLDFRKTLIDTYYKEMQNSTDDYGNIVFKSKQDIDDAGMMPAGIGIGEPIMTSFTGEKSDYGYVIIGEIQLSQVKWTKKFVLSFVRDEMGFTPKFMKVSDYDIKVKLIDINSDDKYEIAVEHFAGDGLKAGHSILSVWTYKNDDFKAIFENDLSEFDRDFPYSYNNKYEFRKNTDNQKLVDIYFNLNTHFDDEIFNDIDNPFYELNHKIFISGKPEIYDDKIVFKFDGERYIPNKEKSDYRSFFMKKLEMLN